MNIKDIEVGDIIRVKAWWLKGELCIVDVLSKSSTYIDVRPIKGNPHARSVRIEDIVEKCNRFD